MFVDSKANVVTVSNNSPNKTDKANIEWIGTNTAVSSSKLLYYEIPH
jgi:hypothetical protein